MFSAVSTMATTTIISSEPNKTTITLTIPNFPNVDSYQNSDIFTIEKKDNTCLDFMLYLHPKIDLMNGNEYTSVYLATKLYHESSRQVNYRVSFLQANNFKWNEQGLVICLFAFTQLQRVESEKGRVTSVSAVGRPPAITP